MNTNLQGSLGEFKAMQVYTERGYIIFAQLTNAAPFDFVAYRDGVCKRVEVKTTARRVKSKGLKYEVKLQSKRGHKNTLRDVKFDSKDCDEVFTYVPEHDFYKIFDSKELDGMYAKTVEVIK